MPVEGRFVLERAPHSMFTFARWDGGWGMQESFKRG
jgi:hypothetical protein